MQIGMTTRSGNSAIGLIETGGKHAKMIKGNTRMYAACAIECPPVVCRKNARRHGPGEDSFGPTRRNWKSRNARHIGACSGESACKRFCSSLSSRKLRSMLREPAKTSLSSPISRFTRRANEITAAMPSPTEQTGLSANVATRPSNHRNVRRAIPSTPTNIHLLIGRRQRVPQSITATAPSANAITPSRPLIPSQPGRSVACAAIAAAIIPPATVRCAAAKPGSSRTCAFPNCIASIPLIMPPRIRSLITLGNSNILANAGARSVGGSLSAA